MDAMTALDITPPTRDGDLTAAERKLITAAITGTLVNLRTGSPELDHPAQADGWDAARIIRAEVLEGVVTGRLIPDGSRPRAVKLGGARITGRLELGAAELICPLLLLNCHLEGRVDLTEATAPAISLTRCHLPGLIADRLRTTGAFKLDWTTTQGIVSLTGAHIGGELNLCGASLNNPSGRALSADLMTVEHSMICRFGFTAQGEVRLAGARIGGRLDLREATLNDPGRCALFADGLNAEYGILCKEGFTAQGEVRAAYSRLGGVLNMTGASLANPGGTALNLQAADIAALWLLPGQSPDGVVDLTNTKTGAFRDDQASWPETLRLRGFTYDVLENDQVTVQDRLQWLTRHPDGYTPQLYDQLAAAYQRVGHEEAARKVRIAKQRHRRAVLNAPGKALNWLLYLTVGYGYRTWLAGAWLAGLLAVSTWVFGYAYPDHMVRTSTYAAAFNPVAYSLDVLLPIVNLGQQSAWQPQGWALYWSWALTGAGWVLTTAVVAGLTSVLKRD
jgi:hypothetical protein